MVLAFFSKGVRMESVHYGHPYFVGMVDRNAVKRWESEAGSPKKTIPDRSRSIYVSSVYPFLD
jgi:hypothetical protein